MDHPIDLSVAVSWLNAHRQFVAGIVCEGVVVKECQADSVGYWIPSTNRELRAYMNY